MMGISGSLAPRQPICVRGIPASRHWSGWSECRRASSAARWRRARAEVQRDFEIKDERQPADGGEVTPVIAGERAEYLVGLYVEPLMGNESRLGFEAPGDTKT